MTDFHLCPEIKAIARVTNHKYHQISHAPTLPRELFFSTWIYRGLTLLSLLVEEHRWELNHFDDVSSCRENSSSESSLMAFFPRISNRSCSSGASELVIGRSVVDSSPTRSISDFPESQHSSLVSVVEHRITPIFFRDSGKPASKTCIYTLILQSSNHLLWCTLERHSFAGISALVV